MLSERSRLRHTVRPVSGRCCSMYDSNRKRAGALEELQSPLWNERVGCSTLGWKSDFQMDVAEAEEFPQKGSKMTTERKLLPLLVFPKRLLRGVREEFAKLAERCFGVFF